MGAGWMMVFRCDVRPNGDARQASDLVGKHKHRAGPRPMSFRSSAFLLQPTAPLNPQLHLRSVGRWVGAAIMEYFAKAMSPHGRAKTQRLKVGGIALSPAFSS